MYKQRSKDREIQPDMEFVHERLSKRASASVSQEQIEALHRGSPFSTIQLVPQANGKTTVIVTKDLTLPGWKMIYGPGSGDGPQAVRILKLLEDHKIEEIFTPEAVPDIEAHLPEWRKAIEAGDFDDVAVIPVTVSVL